MTRRGATNRNERGNTVDRRRRRTYLLRAYESDQGAGTCRCYHCGIVLTYPTLTVDRIKPGCRGGTYRRSNIRPCCPTCNSVTGGASRG